MKKIVLTSVVLLFCCSTVHALDFLGQPSGQLESSQLQLRFGYSQSEIDIITDDDTGDFTDEEIEIRDIDLDKYYFDLVLGFDKGTALFFRVGAAKAEPDRKLNESNFGGYIGDSDDGLLLGGGIKVTLYEEKSFKWGLSVQFTAAQYDFKKADFNVGGINYFDFETKSTVYETMISTGPTLVLNKYVSVYGGPFLHFIRGEIEAEAVKEIILTSAETKIKEDSIIGGFVGAEFTLGDNLSFNIEGQRTNSASGFGGSLAFKF
jgi:opacity protein-like surface antigen